MISYEIHNRLPLVRTRQHFPILGTLPFSPLQISTVIGKPLLFPYKVNVFLYRMNELFKKWKYSGMQSFPEKLLASKLFFLIFTSKQLLCGYRQNLSQRIPYHPHNILFCCEIRKFQYYISSRFELIWRSARSILFCYVGWGGILE